MTVFIVVSLFVLATIMWNSVSTRINQNIIKNDIETTAIDISDQLLKSQGLPTDWASKASQNFSLGLVSKNYQLDVGKVTAFATMNYNDTKSLLGIRGYEFYFKVTDIAGNIISQSGTSLEAGIKPSANSDSVNSKRIALLNKEIVYSDVIIWK